MGVAAGGGVEASDGGDEPAQASFAFDSEEDKPFLEGARTRFWPPI